MGRFAQTAARTALLGCITWSLGCEMEPLDAAVGERQSAVWTSWQEIAGSDATSAPAATSWGYDRLDLFWRGTSGHLEHVWRPPGGQWSGVQDLGVEMVGAPAAVSWGPERIDVFYRATDNQLGHIAYPCYGASWCRADGWSQPEKLGGYLITDPAVSSWGPGRLDVFWVNTQSNLEHKWYDNGWSGTQNLGGSLASAPAAVSWGPGRIDVVWRGTDNGLEHTAYPCYGGSWCRADGWANIENLGHTLTTAPALSSYAEGRLDVFWRDGSTGVIKQKTWQGSWTTEGTVGGPATSPPAATSSGFGRIDVFARGADGHTLIHRVWQPFVGTICSAAMDDFHDAADNLDWSYNSDCYYYNVYYQTFENRAEDVIEQCGAPSALDWLAVADEYQTTYDEAAAGYDFCNSPDAIADRCPIGEIVITIKKRWGPFGKNTTVHYQSHHCYSSLDVDPCNEYFASTQVFGPAENRVVYMTDCVGPQ